MDKEERETETQGNLARLFRRESVLTIPNGITLLRLLLIPLILELYIGRSQYSAALCVILLSGLTDVLDGRIARKYHMISDFGKVFDPLVDKLTQAAMLFCLIRRFANMRILLSLLIVKEVVTGLVGLIQIRTTARVIQADWYGKLTTSLIFAAVALHVAWPELPGIVSDISIGICVACMLLAFFHYVRLDIQAIREKKAENSK